MRLFIFITTLHLVFSSFSFSQGSPERTVRRFTRAINKGDILSASKLCILELRYDIEDDPYKPFRSLSIKTLDCKVTDSKYGKTCHCLTDLNGIRITMIYEVTLVDGKWRIFEIDSERMSSEYSETDYGSTKKPGLPQTALLDYALAIENKNFKKARKMLLLGAGTEFDEQLEKDPSKLPVKIIGIDCRNDYRRKSVDCSCEQISSDGTKGAAHYSMVVIDDQWKISGFNASSSAGQVVRRFVTYLAEGNCDGALHISEGSAVDLVQGQIDAGCVQYSTEIKSIECEEEYDSAVCTCVEVREGGLGEMTYKYDLALSNGQWFVTNYQKDFDMEAEPSTEEAVEYVEVPIDTLPAEPEEIFVVTDFDPTYPGGKIRMQDFIDANLIYPEASKTKKTEGTVHVQFAVMSDGTIREATVVKGVNTELDNEALRIVNSMPEWVPGRIGGLRVASYYTLAIRFDLTP